MPSTTEAAGRTGHRQRLKRLIAGLLVITSLAFAQGPIFIPGRHSTGGTAGGGITVYSGLATFTGTLYFPVGGGSLPSATEGPSGTINPASATISNFGVNISAPPGIGATIVFTWRDAGAGTSLSCTITGVVATSCRDLTHSLTAAQGDLLDIQAVTTGSVGGTPVVVMSAEFGTVNAIPLNNRIRSFGGSFDGGGTALTPGKTTYVTVPFACTISAWNILATPADTATLVTWKIATGTAIPTVANSISTAGNSIASGTAIHSTTVTDFTTLAVLNNDIVGINLFAVGGVATFVNYVVECDQ